MVVERLPSAVRNALVPLTPEEIDATGVPELTLSTANLAEAVAFAPTNRSKVSLKGETVPELSFQ